MRKTQAMVATLTRQTTRDGLIAGARGLSQFIDSVTPKPPHQPLGTELPHRIVDYHAGPPTLGTQIAPAYAPNTPNAEPSNLPRTPTAADTSETIEIQFTEDISKTANDLSKDPVKMYEFVRNNMNFEPYYGSRKGANETLLEKGGNDFDQASLLITLFRFSGIPARYVQGVVDVPIAKAMNWVGVEKPEVAAKMFSAGGIPSQAVISGGRISALRIEHVWCEVYVNYENYRGAEAGPGKKQWIPLGPSFKQYKTQPAEPLTSVIGNTMQEALSVDLTAVAASGKSEALAPRRQIVVRVLGLLPTTLPNGAPNVKAEFVEVPDARRELIVFSLSGASHRAVVADLAGKRITESYSPATSQDQAVVAEYGDVSLAPSYLVNLRPQVRVDGDVVLSGDPLSAGSSHAFTMSFVSPGGATEAVRDQMQAGSAYGIGLSLGEVPQQLLTRGTNELAVRISNTAETSVLEDNAQGQALWLAAEGYFCQLDARTDFLARKSGFALVRGISSGNFGWMLATSSLFGQIVSSYRAGAQTDIDRYIQGAFCTEGDDRARAAAFTLYAGIASSSLEAEYSETFFGQESVSTTRLFKLAEEQGVAIHELEPESAESSVQALSIGDADKADIMSALRAGYAVAVPAREIQVHDWRGTGYVVLDRSTGSTAFVISGGLAGGSWTKRFPTPLNVHDACQLVVDLVNTAKDVLVDISFLSTILLFKVAWDLMNADSLEEAAKILAEAAPWVSVVVDVAKFNEYWGGVWSEQATFNGAMLRGLYKTDLELYAFVRRNRDDVPYREIPGWELMLDDYDNYFLYQQHIENSQYPYWPADQFKIPNEKYIPEEIRILVQETWEVAPH